MMITLTVRPEGGGIADVLVGDATGNPRYNFTGRLPFGWPAEASSPATPEGHNVKWPRGFGLDYAAEQ